MNIINLHKKSFQQIRGNQMDIIIPQLKTFSILLGIGIILAIAWTLFNRFAHDSAQYTLYILDQNPLLTFFKIIATSFALWLGAESFRNALKITSNKLDLAEKKESKNFPLLTICLSSYLFIIKPVLAFLATLVLTVGLNLFFSIGSKGLQSTVTSTLIFLLNIFLLNVPTFLLFVFFDKKTGVKNSIMKTLHLFKRNYIKLIMNNILIACYAGMIFALCIAFGSIFSQFITGALLAISVIFYFYYITPFIFITYANLYLDANNNLTQQG